MAEYYGIHREAAAHRYYWVHQAMQGGRGSHNFGDASKSGARGLRLPDSPFESSGWGNPTVIAGTGGGARPTPLLKFGSDAPGYSPGGVVVVRLFKVVDP